VNHLKTRLTQRPRKVLALTTVLLSAAGLGLPIYADTTTSDLALTASVTSRCTISVTNLDFGAYDPIVANATQDLTASSTISTTCTLGTTGVVTMSKGGHFLYCVVNDCHRRLANTEGTSFLRYNIYTASSYSFSAIWNHDVEEMRSVAGVLGTGVSRDLTVYGEVPKNQKYATAGSYSDSINVILTY